MFRRPLLLLPVLVAALALPVSPALAGEEDDDSAKLHASQGCVTGDRTQASVSGDNIDNVAFYVDGDLVKRVTGSNADGRYTISMNCARLRVGAHRASAVVTFEGGSRRVLRFQITRAAQVSPRFTG